MFLGAHSGRNNMPKKIVSCQVKPKRTRLAFDINFTLKANLLRLTNLDKNERNRIVNCLGNKDKYECHPDSQRRYEACRKDCEELIPDEYFASINGKSPVMKARASEPGLIHHSPRVKTKKLSHLHSEREKQLKDSSQKGKDPLLTGILRIKAAMLVQIDYLYKLYISKNFGL